MSLWYRALLATRNKRYQYKHERKSGNDRKEYPCCTLTYFEPEHISNYHDDGIQKKIEHTK